MLSQIGRVSEVLILPAPRLRRMDDLRSIALRIHPCYQLFVIGREDVVKSFGPASVVLRGYGRKVGAGPGLTCYPA